MPDLNYLISITWLIANICISAPLAITKPETSIASITSLQRLNKREPKRGKALVVPCSLKLIKESNLIICGKEEFEACQV